MIFDDEILGELETWEPKEGDLDNIGELAKRMVECQSVVRTLEEELTKAKSTLKEVQEGNNLKEH